MTGTVKDHLEQADQIQAHVKEADALVRKLKTALEKERDALEWLRDFSPQDWVTRGTQYKGLGDFRNDRASMSEMIDARAESTVRRNSE